MSHRLFAFLLPTFLLPPSLLHFPKSLTKLGAAQVCLDGGNQRFACKGPFGRIGVHAVQDVIGLRTLEIARDPRQLRFILRVDPVKGHGCHGQFQALPFD